MRGAKLWTALATVMLLSTIAMLAGFAYAVDTVTNPKAGGLAQPEENKPSERLDGDIHIVALGDSLTKGFGDPEGKGYAGYVKDKLEEMVPGDVALANFAVNGRTSEQLLEDVTIRTGVIENIREADIVLLTIGGNDLYQMGVEISGAELERIASRVPETLHRVEQAFGQIHALNPEAKVFYMGLYNPFQEVDPQGQASIAIQEWNTRIFASALKFRTVSVIPTFDLFYNQDTLYLSEDHYHPNGDGYMRMAERVIQALEGVIE